MDDDRSDEHRYPHVPATANATDAPTEDDYDHTGHERKEDQPGGNRGGGDPNSPLGR